MKGDIKNGVFEFLKFRSPNPVRETVIIDRLNKYDLEDVLSALAELQTENKIIMNEYLNNVTKKEVRSYRLKSFENITIREFIKIGDFSVPRTLNSDKIEVFPEDMNQSIESLSEYSSSLEERFKKIVEQEQKKYWGNIITLFGIFVAIFSLIIVSLPRIETSPYFSFWQILTMNTAQILPVALILGLFVLVLKLIFR